MTIEEAKHGWLGIDFSGDHRMWRANRKSNVYIAEVRKQQGHLFLNALRTVQELPGHQEPFERLANLLKHRSFRAAAIDAPFSVPCNYIPPGGHKALLELVAGIEPPRSRPFPDAEDFVCRVLARRELSEKKPLRWTEFEWRERNINVRSTLWSGPRGGAAMTAACLALLHRSQCPIWPWHDADESGLLVEAFPAAQLCHWGMKYEKYNGDNEVSIRNRHALVGMLSESVEIPKRLRERMEETADALDAVVCAFAAIAVSTGRLAESALRSEEGQIAVCSKIEGQAW